MALTPQELKQWVQDKINADRLSWTAQNDVSFERGLHHKYDQQLLDVIELYKNKYQKIIEFYKEYLEDIQGKITNFDISKADLKSDLLSMKDKVMRIADKYWAVKWELEGRKLNIFKRNPVGTIYYIDLDNGNDSNDGLSTSQAWLTIQKYTSVTVRSPGDIAKVRANTSQTATAVINCDEDGNDDNYIEIRGCSVADDPWGDASDVKPILTFGDGAYYLYVYNDDFWKLNRLVVKEANSSSGNIYIKYARGIYLLNLDSIDNSNSGGKGINLLDAINFIIEGCSLKDNLDTNIYAKTSKGQIINTSLDGGATTTDRGLYAFHSSYVEIVESEFGQITAHDLQDIRARHNSIVKLRNTKLGTAGIEVVTGGVIFEEDADGTFEAGKITHYEGLVTKDTSIKTGNADFSCKMEPNSYCGINDALSLNCGSIIEFPFNVKLSASVQKTITIKIRSLGTWSTYPTNTELYIEASYYDSTSDAGRSTIKSTQVLSHPTNWVDFTVTLTPQRDGDVYINVYLKKYEASKGCYVNGEISIS